MLRLYILDLGRMKVDSNFAEMFKNTGTYDYPDRPNTMVELPIQAFLIESDHGYMLYDTGCHAKTMTERWPEFLKTVSPWFGDETTTPMYILDKMGIRNDEIKTIIISHMHNDHAGNIEYFPKAHYMVSKNEFAACVTSYALHNMNSSYVWNDIDHWIKQPIDWELIEEEDGDVEVIPGVTIINLGSGHCPGVLALKVDLENTGSVILTSDACFTKGNFENLATPSNLYDGIGWRRSLKKLRRIAKESNATVFYGHDIEQFNTLKKAPECYD